MILLPGIGDGADAWSEHGLVDAARERLDADLVAVSAHYRYYASDEIADRLWMEVVAPARSRYDEVWLVGISLGGLGAVLTARAYPDDIDGVVLLAPYLGSSYLPRTIAAEGGLRAWEPPPPPAAFGWQVQLWSWLKRYEQSDGELPELYLAYGRQDALSLAHGLIAEVLPPDHVIVADGDHYWSTWATLWGKLVGRDVLRLGGAAAG